jgi:hypothetical protein
LVNPDGWTTATDFPDKAVHTLASSAITGVGTRREPAPHRLSPRARPTGANHRCIHFALHHARIAARVWPVAISRASAAPFTDA